MSSVRPATWISTVYEMDSARSLLNHADETVSGARLAEESIDPLVTVASIGAEKMLKMTLGVINTEMHGTWPTKTVMRGFGHDITELDRTCRDLLDRRAAAMLGQRRGTFEAICETVDSNPVVAGLLELLSRYAQNGRFYNLDELANQPQPNPAPRELWRTAVEAAVHRADPMIASLLSGIATWDAGVARLFAQVRRALASWRELYFSAWIWGLCGEDAKQYGWTLQPPKAAHLISVE